MKRSVSRSGVLLHLGYQSQQHSRYNYNVSFEVDCTNGRVLKVAGVQHEAEVVATSCKVAGPFSDCLRA